MIITIIILSAKFCFPGKNCSINNIVFFSRFLGPFCLFMAIITPKGLRGTRNVVLKHPGFTIHLAWRGLLDDTEELVANSSQCQSVEKALLHREEKPSRYSSIMRGKTRFPSINNSQCSRGSGTNLVLSKWLLLLKLSTMCMQVVLFLQNLKS